MGWTQKHCQSCDTRNAGECSIRFQNRKPDEKFWFRDSAGGVLFAELRWNLPDDDKRVRPCIYTSDGWREEAPPAPRALFNLDKLAKLPDAPVYLFEGPRKAAKAAPCFPNAVCIAFWGGAHAAKQTDFSPLRGRASALWRDATKLGRTGKRRRLPSFSPLARHHGNGCTCRSRRHS